MKVVSVESMRRIEAAADVAGISYATMMQNAGYVAAQRILQIIENIPSARVLFLIGSGNNGGDGLVAAKVMAEARLDVARLYLLTRRKDDPLVVDVQSKGLFVVYAEDDPDGRVLGNIVVSSDVVVDALFGIGMRLPLRGDAAKLLRGVNQSLHEHRNAKQFPTLLDPTKGGQILRSPKVVVLAIDCPSGLDCNTGELDENVIYADETITFIAAKYGQFLAPGVDAVGRLLIAEAGVPDYLPRLMIENDELVDAETLRRSLPIRSVAGHKGTFGKALILAGSFNYRGAVSLSAKAAYRSGVGLVTVGAPETLINALSGGLWEPTWLKLAWDEHGISPENLSWFQNEVIKYDALLMGPGWGTGSATALFLRGLMELGERLPPLLIDADGLNLLSTMHDWWKLLPPNTIITPHPAEMGRLCGLTAQDVQANRWNIVREKAGAWGIHVVLKGAHTLIASADGHVSVLPFKTDALAKGGTGDVLSGIIVGLLAQGVQPIDAAIMGGYLHGLSGQVAAEKLKSSRSVIAGDVVEAIGEAFARIEQ